MSREKDDPYFLKEYESGTKVVWDKRVARQLAVVPRNIAAKFFDWADAVRLVGLRQVRKSTGFHDEPLKGDRKGQRSMRLNRSYRVIYVEGRDGDIEIVEVIEVNKHEY